jgi:hypothetical protein
MHSKAGLERLSTEAVRFMNQRQVPILLRSAE